MIDTLGVVSGGVEAQRTLALPVAWGVVAGPAPAHSLQALVLVPALPVSRHLIAGQTVAVVTLLSVHTSTVGTEVGVQGALVYPTGEVGGNIPAQQLVLRSPRRGTGLAQVGLQELPTLAHRLTAAAVYLGQLEWHLA